MKWKHFAGHTLNVFKQVIKEKQNQNNKQKSKRHFQKYHWNWRFYENYVWWHNVSWKFRLLHGNTWMPQLCFVEILEVLHFFLRKSVMKRQRNLKGGSFLPRNSWIRVSLSEVYDVLSYDLLESLWGLMSVIHWHIKCVKPLVTLGTAPPPTMSRPGTMRWGTTATRMPRSVTHTAHSGVLAQFAPTIRRYVLPSAFYGGLLPSSIQK